MKRVGRKIRVGHLITNFVVGGAQDYLLTILKGLNKSRFEVFVGGKMEGEWCEKLRSIKGIHIVEIPSLGRKITPLADMRSVFQIKRFCQEAGLDILHTHSSKPGVVGRLGGYLADVPVIVHTIHGFPFHDFMPAIERSALIILERWMASLSTSLLFVSTMDELQAKRLAIRPRQRGETVYNGIDFSPYRIHYNRDEIRRSLRFGKDDFVVGFSGRLSKQKGVTILLKGFSRALGKKKSFRLLLIGDGPLRPKLEARIRSMNMWDAVRITGFRSDVARLLSALDVFVMPSLWEGLSRSVIEAMYARIPVIATDVGGTAEAVKPNVRGWLISPNRAEDIEKALLVAFDRSQGNSKVVDAAFRWARANFDVKTMQHRIASVYFSLLQNHEGHRP